MARLQVSERDEPFWVTDQGIPGPVAFQNKSGYSQGRLTVEGRDADVSITRDRSRTPFQRRLSALDSLFVYTESTLRPLNITLLSTFDGKIKFDDLVRAISRRIHVLPGFRQRLLEVPFGFAYPMLADDPEFRLENHLRLVHLPPSADRAQAMGCAFGEYQMMLDRSRPLWRIVLFEDWPGECSAIALTIHHCLCDGVGAVRVLGTLLDRDSGAPWCEPEQSRWRPSPMPDPYQLIRNASKEFWIRQSGIIADFALELARNPCDFAHRNQLGLQGIGELLGSSWRPIVSVPWNAGPASNTRSFEDFSVDMSDIEAIRRSVGGTINDIALCVFTEGAARYMKHHGFRVDGWFRVSCGVSTRGEESSAGNLLSSMFPEIPAINMNLIERLQAVRDETWRIKSFALPQALERLGFLAELNPVAVMAWARSEGIRFSESSNPGTNDWRFGSDATPRISFFITNLCGSPARQYLCSCACLEQVPSVPIGPGFGYGVAILSYDQLLSFALIADTMRMPDLDFMKECVKGALDDLIVSACRRHH
jgi:diacylglycerol O-acyltransferase / wax synthase